MFAVLFLFAVVGTMYRNSVAGAGFCDYCISCDRACYAYCTDTCMDCKADAFEHNAACCKECINTIGIYTCKFP